MTSDVISTNTPCSIFENGKTMVIPWFFRYYYLHLDCEGANREEVAFRMVEGVVAAVCCLIDQLVCFGEFETFQIGLRSW